MIASTAGGNVGAKRFGSYDTLDADVRLTAERVRDFLGDVDASVDADGVYSHAESTCGHAPTSCAAARHQAPGRVLTIPR